MKRGGSIDGVVEKLVLFGRGVSLKFTKDLYSGGVQCCMQNIRKLIAVCNAEKT